MKSHFRTFLVTPFFLPFFLQTFNFPLGVTGKIMSYPDLGNFDFQQISMILPPNFHTMEVSKRLEVSWKFVGSRNDFHDLERHDFSSVY